MQQFMVAAGLAQWPPGRTEQLWPRYSEMTTGALKAGRAHAVTVRLPGILMRRVIGANLDRLRVDCDRLFVEVKKRGYVITASGPQARLFGAESWCGFAIHVERGGLVLLARTVGRAGYR